MRAFNAVMVLFASMAPAAVNSQDLSVYSAANALVETANRYAAPPGVFLGSAPAGPTGPGTAILPVGLFDNASGTATSSYGSASTAPFASASALLVSPGPRNPAGQGVDAEAYTYYAFEVVGPAAMTGSLSLVDLTASGSVSADPSAENGGASATLLVRNGSLAADSPNILDLDTSISCSLSVCDSTAGFSDTRTPISIPINQIILVYLNASATSNVPLGSADSSGSFSATIDPIFALDVFNPPGLDLVIGSPIVQPSAVAEPPGVSLMLAGLVLLAIFRRPREILVHAARRLNGLNAAA